MAFTSPSSTPLKGWRPCHSVKVSRRPTVGALRRFQAGGLVETAYRSNRILDAEGLGAFVMAERQATGPRRRGGQRIAPGPAGGPKGGFLLPGGDGGEDPCRLRRELGIHCPPPTR